MNTRILAAIAVVLLGAVAGYFALETRDESEPQPRTAAGDAAGEAPGVPEETQNRPQAARDQDAPSFDLVRVEPSGELVAAGRARAQARVELVSANVVLADADTNASGEWAMVLGQPLGVGSHDMALRATSRDGSEPVYGDHVAIVIQDDGETPLVAVTPQGEPSRVVQRPEKPDEDASQRLAMAGDDALPADGDAEAGAEIRAPEAPEAEAGGPAETGRAEPDAEPADFSDGAATTGDEPAALAGDELAMAEDEPGDTALPGQAETSAGDGAPSARMAEDTDGGQDETADLPDETADLPEPGLQPGPNETSDLPEIGGGSGTDESPSDERQVAALPEGASSGDEQDVAGSDASDEPVTAEPDAGATAEGDDASMPSEPAALPDDDVPETAAAQPEAETDEGPAGDVESGTLSIETVEVEEPETLMMSGQAEPAATVRLYVNNEALGTVEADASGNWFITGSRALPPGQYEVRADTLGAGGEVTARAAVRFDRVQLAFSTEGGTSGEVSAGQADVTGTGVVGEGRGAAGTATAPGTGSDASIALINRGDNLWTIARRLYGSGVRYTAIYDANRTQIRDPDLIYPGQVFTIPYLDEDQDPAD
ncbi:LysM peptidoglycan-binding domain-containing protein [Lutibaculum baratangense]|uniref:LysM domain-containing protein n=1 Tax=Lutibaculum baratangense AMV1 TaxID=631454 RepID=V4RI31_9HYPH|nr:LysM peptidoglycan-binding domain-containing protein [Lutibaculum baratangense]ESR22920.1 hypothetical protein N177_4057 [Lutibaculum baratangense AMV1]